MAGNLFPLIYSAGIQRDGTKFQSDYCINAQWIRFQRGNIKKIGGMKGSYTLPAMNRVTDLPIFPWENGGESLVFICGETGLYAQVNSPDWSYTSNNLLLNKNLADTGMWETDTVVETASNKSYIVFMLNNNAKNINDNSRSLFYKKEIATATTGVAEIDALEGVNPLMNGGLVFAAPYLFLYGSNGLIQYSKTIDPFDFSLGDGSGSQVIATDKIIYGHSVRGGSFSPSLLFWTLSSVVRVSNTGSNSGESSEDSFSTDVLSKSTSILSSKCVVEYDGEFFWPGTERFFVYNGIIQEMDNRINLNYFYDNIDMNRRQQVFGVKNTKFGEIWWFYPDKNIPGANSRALIYNKRENSWYDTAISRTAGSFSSDFGFLSTYGRFLEQDAGENNIWKHEVDVQQDSESQAGRVLDPIISSVTTPIISWVAFPPKPSKAANSASLINRWIDLQRIEPDFVSDDVTPTNLEVVVNTQEYAQSKIIRSDPVSFSSNTPKLDMRVQGRNMSLTFTSEETFEVGKIILLLGMGDAR